MMTCDNHLEISYSFYELASDRESKITLTFSYYFSIGRPEQFYQKSSSKF